MRMECHPTITADGDVPYWIKKKDFLECFDQTDAFFNLPEKLVPGYLIQWFSCDERGTLTLTMPGIHFVKAKTEFFYGRHRAALLFEVDFMFHPTRNQLDNLIKGCIY